MGKITTSSNAASLPMANLSSDQVHGKVQVSCILQKETLDYWSFWLMYSKKIFISFFAYGHLYPCLQQFFPLPALQLGELGVF